MLPSHVAQYLSEYTYKIELHAHTNPCSGCSRLSPKALIGLLKEQGYDAVVIVNHFFYDHGAYRETEDPITTYLKDFYEAKEEGKKQGIKVFLGAEYRFLESQNDYLVIGVDEEFLRKTFHRSELGIASFYDEFHSDDLLIIQAHPFRNTGCAADLKSLDGLEIMNVHPGQQSRSVLAAKFAADAGAPLVTIGTDVHETGHVGLSALRTKVLPQNEKQLIEILKSGDYVFDIGGYPMLPSFTFDK